MTGPAEILRRLEQAGPADRELLARFAIHRDQTAFAELVRRYGPIVFGVCRRVTGHVQDAEDAFQAVFLILARKAGSIASPELIGNWLYGVAVRVAHKAKRAAARRRVREVTVSLVPDRAIVDSSLDSDLRPILDEELAALPAWYRDAVLLCDLRGLSREEAAELLRIPEGTLSSRLASGRKKLAARLTKRGITLSVAVLPTMVSESLAAIAVPNELSTKTCSLVADWSAGVAVPDSLARLASGGLSVRRTILLGVVTSAIALTGVVYAGRGDDPPRPADPQEPPAGVAKGDPPPEAKPNEQRAAFTTRPRMRAGQDLGLKLIQAIAWSPTGDRLAIQGTDESLLAPGTTPKGKTARRTSNAIFIVELNETGIKDAGRSVGGTLSPVARLIGFTPDGKELLIDQREYTLVSGFHQLNYYAFDTREGLKLPPGVSFGPIARRRETVNFEAHETHGYFFATDGKTFRTVGIERDASGKPSKIDVVEVDAVTGKRMRSLLTTEYEDYRVAPNGKRLGTLDVKGQVTIYDLDRGMKIASHMLPAPPHAEALSKGILRGSPGNVTQVAPDRTSFSFSPDGRRLVISRSIGQTIVLDADTGKPLPPLEAIDLSMTQAGPGAFTRDGRLLALRGTRYVTVKIKGFGGGGREAVAYNTDRSFLTVWDTQTGKVLKSWDCTAEVAFSPVRPVLAMLERNGEETRLGLWDFSAEVEKK